MTDLTIALIGNPNSGKTTLFNQLTGASQKVGNWPGVTVEKKSGHFSLDSYQIELVDLPGIYSLEQETLALDEKIAQQFLLNENIDVIINIVDASNLERNLVLTQQLLNGSAPVIVAANMLDVAGQQGHKLHLDKLSENLKVPVLPVVASKGEGIDALKHSILEALSIETPVHDEVREPLVGGQYSSESLIRRYHHAKELVNGVVELMPIQHTLTERIDRWVLNRWLGIPFFLFMIYLMFTLSINLGAIFIDFFDILFAAVLVDGSKWLLSLVSAPEWIVVLLADGLGGGIQLVATFIPVIGFLYLCLSILEDSGYMSRAAFVIDRLMGKLGLPGHAFVPLIVGFGCNVPSVMASRSLGTDRDRLLTIAMAPYMSCGARLTVYALFAAAFFPVNGQNIVFLLYLLGIAMAIFTGYVFRKQIFSGDITPSFQEMPAYHVPVLRNILLVTWFRLKSFIFRAGKTIVAVVIALSFLNSISLDGSFGHENTDRSALATIGKGITPVFAPIGVAEDNWPATVGLFTGLFAKEAVVGTLDALYSSSNEDKEAASGAPDIAGATIASFESIKNNAVDLLSNLGDPLGIDIGDISDQSQVAEDQGVQTSTLSAMAAAFGSPFAAFCYMVFILLYSPCVAVLGVIVKESGVPWMVLVFCWTFGLAYITASCIYQIGTLMEHPTYSILWLVVSGVILGIGIQSLKLVGKRSVPPNLIQAVQI